ncbi:hypothetical protein HMPREF9136_2295 [Prevotella dentalis DSM 3688]|uniref:Uncharacterized protein n=1 Tax=Prevotella dentalis (strain ATCC 49559 / DSM 3688 / JCM 13448 / NCTC 12043 / ES 2772) TaxID=908937 RepID=F9D617_PREDD|nr:hypothetical protein HMPREF9136_2295 [Prevotella dentalis DSM 3688]
MGHSSQGYKSLSYIKDLWKLICISPFESILEVPTIYLVENSMV